MTIQELKAELLRLAKLVPAEEWAVYDDNEGMSPPRPLLCIANDIFHNPNDYKEHEQEGAIQLQINCGWPVDADYIVAVQPKNILALLEHVEGLERDARRYRWIRDSDEQAVNPHIQEMWAKCETHYPSPEEWDNAIDAALAEQGEKV